MYNDLFYCAICDVDWNLWKVIKVQYDHNMKYRHELIHKIQKANLGINLRGRQASRDSQMGLKGSRPSWFVPDNKL